MKPSRSWPADRIERWPLERICEAQCNPRTHSPEQIGQIAASLREFGWTFPLLVDEAGEIIAGHGRLAAARLLDFTDAPVIVARGWTDAQKRAYRIADNKLALNAGWDAALLSEELALLGGEGFAIDLLGFSDADMARLVDDTDRIALDHAAQIALAADPADWRTDASQAGLAGGAGSAITAGASIPASGPASTSNGAPGALPVAPANPGIELAVFSCMVTLAGRPVLFDAINRAKEHGAPDTGAALILIAREWMES